VVINSFLLASHCEYVQSKLSIQFDDLFKKAWEEDTFSELEGDDHTAGSESPKAEAEPDAKASISNEVSKGLETDVTVLDEILSSAKTAIMSEEAVTGSSDKQLRKEVRTWILHFEI
jgi:antiviral helicase SKI2